MGLLEQSGDYPGTVNVNLTQVLENLGYICGDPRSDYQAGKVRLT